MSIINRSDAAIASQIFSDASEFARSTRPADISCIQTCAGNFRLEWTGLRIGELGLQFMSLPAGSCAAIGETAPQGESFHIPLGISERISVMGQSMDGRQISAYNPRSEHAICGAKGARLVYVVPPPGSLAAIAPSVIGCDYTSVSRDGFIMGGQPEFTDGLRTTLESLWYQCATTPQALLHHEVGRNVKETILEKLLKLLGSELTADQRVGRHPVSRTAVLASVDNYLRARPNEPIYVSELCKEARVSQPTLYRIFHEILGMGPKQFLLIRRLHKVRQRLLDGDPALLTVSSVAFDFGFWQLSRFARYYKLFFGESPSETLRHKKSILERKTLTVHGHSTILGWTEKASSF